jgi:hypothetical protein
MIVSLSLLGLVAVAITSTLMRQTRSARAAAELTELRDQLREGAHIMVSDLRSVSAATGDIYPGLMGKHSIEFRSTFGASVLCAMSGPSIIHLPPNTQLASGARFSHVRQRVDPGHGLLIFDEGATDDVGDDAWLLRTITTVVNTPNACTASSFSSTADVSLLSYRIELNAPLPATVTAGAPVRFVERVRYALYQSSDNKWYLGHCESASLSVSCAPLQPLSGPYSPPDADQGSGQGGLDLYYYDAGGLTTVDPLRVSRIDIALRGSASSALSLAGRSTPSPPRDTLRLVLRLRNQ